MEKKAMKEKALTFTQEDIEPFEDDLIIPDDLPKTEEERDAANKKYLERWHANKEEIKKKFFKWGILWEAVIRGGTVGLWHLSAAQGQGKNKNRHGEQKCDTNTERGIDGKVL